MAAKRPKLANASAGLGWLGRAVRHVVEGPVDGLLRFASLDNNVVSVLERRAVSDSADYIRAMMPRALALRSREALWSLAIRNSPRAGLWLEFGVFKAYSTNYLARHTEATVYGFDSFHGLQEDWHGVGHVQGSFDLAGRLPRTRSNVSLIAGWFNDTVPGFLTANAEQVALLHLDCDTYESTAYVLGQMKDRLTPESVVVLDDYHGFWGYREGQFRAWAEFVAAHGLDYRYAAFNRHAVVIQDIRPSPAAAATAQ